MGIRILMSTYFLLFITTWHIKIHKYCKYCHDDDGDVGFCVFVDAHSPLPPETSPTPAPGKFTTSSKLHDAVFLSDIYNIIKRRLLFLTMSTQFNTKSYI